ncbi:hypothetical protein ACSSS7_001920 [Eimeria intestinalis]
MEPCTASEVENLKYDWFSSFKDTVEGKGKLLLLRNMKVMGDTGLVYTDETMTNQAACDDASKYQGIFCRGMASMVAGSSALFSVKGLRYHCADKGHLSNALVATQVGVRVSRSECHRRGSEARRVKYDSRFRDRYTRLGKSDFSDADCTRPSRLHCTKVVWSKYSSVRLRARAALYLRPATSFKVDTAKSSPIGYTEEYFSSRPPLIFGSIILSQDDAGKRMLAEAPRESLTGATWTPKIFEVTNDTCKAFIFEEAGAGTVLSRIASLLVQAHLSAADEETVPDFLPNCGNAKLKEGASEALDCTAECTKLANACSSPKAWDCFVKAAGEALKRNCYVEPYVEIGLTVTTSTTLPPVADTVMCRIVDMTSPAYTEDIGWDVHAMSCYCPQGFDPCTPAQVEQDRAHWIKDVSLWGDLCRSYDNVQPVAWGFMQVAYDICMVKSNLKWQKRPFPLYSFDDVFLKGALKRSGYNQCAEETPFVFCPIRRRRRAQLLPARGNGAPCVLEQTVPCTFESPTPCDSLCRHSEWSQWSECTEKLLEFGVTPVTASSREKHVFAESGEACSANKLREFDSSRCTGKNPSSGSTGAPSALQVEAEVSASAAAELWSEWSSCDAPKPNVWPPHNAAELAHQEVHSGVSTAGTGCDDISPQHDVPENQEFCRQNCRVILKACEEEAKHSGTTALQCLVTNILNSQTLRGKCLLSPKLEKEAASPMCFASFARANDDESSKFRFLDPHSDAVQCLCLTANSVPCTAAEVFQSRQLSFESLSSFACPLQDEAGALFDSETPGSADSKLYFAAANSSKIFCAISNSRRQQQQAYNATYSTFASAAEMNEYCANGLPAQLKYSSSTPCKVAACRTTTHHLPFVHRPKDCLRTKACPGLRTCLRLYADDVGLDCERATPKVSTASPQDCKSKCLDIKHSCSESSANFLSCVATKRQTTEFDKECAAHANVIAGKGLVFCKLIPRDCEYSEWGEWSECSSTCRQGPGATANSVRLRSRQILQPSSTGGEPCKFGLSSKDLDEEASLSFTPKPEPSLQPWSSDTPTTTSTEPTVDSTGRVTCNIVDMSSVQRDIGYDAGVRNLRHT